MHQSSSRLNSTLHSQIYDKMLEDEHYSPREDPPSAERETLFPSPPQNKI